ncbi:MAG: amidohydrolase family protein, partial [Patescibacteria group bacterium]|nr:amidohydrolase family protein [Patescibacteria group bacterium]
MKSPRNIQQSLKAHANFEAEPGEHGRYAINNKNYKRVLVHNAPFLFTCDENEKIAIKKNHSIIIEGDTIKDVLPADSVDPKGFDVVYDAGKRGGTVITPGLINTHSHTHMYLMRSAMMLDEGESIDETIRAMAEWQQYETEESLTIASIGDLTEQQKHGITTTLTHGPSFMAAETAGQACSHNLINAVSAISNSRPENTPETVEQLFRDQKGYHSTPAAALHYLYKANASALKKVRDITEKHGALVTFHMAESEGVVNQTIKQHGMRELAVLKKYGLLNEQSLASHVLHVTDEEIAELVAHKVGIAHLPTSNTIHKSGTFRFWIFDEYGGAPLISLGTDSVVSKNRLDLLTEAYQSRITHLYERTVKFGSLFKMMTINGARVLHMPERGRIIKGAKADIVFWKLKDRGFIPYDEANPITLLGNIITHGGRYVRDLMINGRFVIKDRKHLLVDESTLLAETQTAHMHVRGRVARVEIEQP